MTRRRAASGSSVSAKEIARSVRDGRLVTFNTLVGEVTGYVCGMDDYHWRVVTSGGTIHLVHKTAPQISFDNRCGYDLEPQHDLLEDIIGPFRQHVLTTYFGYSHILETAS